MKTKAPAGTAHVYVVTRLDIPAPHVTVQVAHAAIAATFAFGKPNETHPNLVVCAVRDEPELAAAFERLKEQGVPCCAWYEDDMGKALTAATAAPLEGKARRPFRDFKLLPGR